MSPGDVQFVGIWELKTIGGKSVIDKLMKLTKKQLLHLYLREVVKSPEGEMDRTINNSDLEKFGWDFQRNYDLRVQKPAKDVIRMVIKVR